MLVECCLCIFYAAYNGISLFEELGCQMIFVPFTFSLMKGLASGGEGGSAPGTARA